MKQSIAILARAVLILLPTIPLSITWVYAVRQKALTSAFWRAGAPLAWITLSTTWFITGLFVEQVLGSSYTTRRFTTIYLNLLLALGTLAFGLTVRSPVRLGIILSSATLVLVWFYAAFVSSAV